MKRLHVLTSLHVLVPLQATGLDWAGDPLPFSPEGLGRPEDGQDEVRRVITAGIWVAFFQECQQ